MKEISGVFKWRLLLIFPVNPKREDLFSALCSRHCDLTDVELFLFHAMLRTQRDRMC